MLTVWLELPSYDGAPRFAREPFPRAVNKQCYSNKRETDDNLLCRVIANQTFAVVQVWL